MGGSPSTERHSVLAYRCQATGQSAVVRNKDYAGALVKGINGVNTLYANFQRGVKMGGDKPCLGTREAKADGTVGDYVWESYNQVNKRLTNFGSGLLALGLRKSGFVGLLSSNRAEWVLAEQACNAYGLVSVPLYDTLGPDAVSYVVNQTEMTTLVCSVAKLGVVMDACAQCPTLRNVIVMDRKPSSEESARASTLAVNVLGFCEVEATGAADPKPHDPASPDDLATICYTSGTTGDPKGVMLTNQNFAAALAGVNLTDVAVLATDVHLSYLPLAHMFERIVQAALYHHGGSVGFYQGDVTKLLEDLAVLRPTIFPSVPRLFNRIYDKLVQGVAVAGGLKKFLFDYALASKKYYLKDGFTQHSVWDKLVFSKLRALLGGRVRVMITGSAPISSSVKDFLQVVFCCPVYEGYGLTETCAIGTTTPTDARYAGHVGVPAACVEVRLDDIPEMDYLSTDKPCPRGEICFRGPCIFGGYYKKPEKTAECISDGGWFHTGDVGRLNADGTISIIDRKKNIFKLAQGEYIAPEKIENIYCRSPLVAQAFVYGDSLKSKLVAIIVPDAEVVETWAATNKVSGDAFASPKLHAAILAEMGRVATEAKLHGFECARAMTIDKEPFAVENQLLTPTFKLVRNKLRAHYKADIDRMYAELPN